MSLLEYVLQVTFKVDSVRGIYSGGAAQGFNQRDVIAPASRQQCEIIHLRVPAIAGAHFPFVGDFSISAVYLLCLLPNTARGQDSARPYLQLLLDRAKAIDRSCLSLRRSPACRPSARQQSWKSYRIIFCTRARRKRTARPSNHATGAFCLLAASSRLSQFR